jgi:hypothetical protein
VKPRSDPAPAKLGASSNERFLTADFLSLDYESVALDAARDSLYDPQRLGIV